MIQGTILMSKGNYNDALVTYDKVRLVNPFHVTVSLSAPLLHIPCLSVCLDEVRFVHRYACMRPLSPLIASAHPFRAHKRMRAHASRRRQGAAANLI